MNRSFDRLMHDLVSYANRPDDSSPVSFSDIATQFPKVSTVAEGDAVVGVAHFAEMGYCLYKAWHHGRGTPKKQTSKSTAALQRGEDYHEKREAADRARVKDLPKATRKQLRDPSINIAEIPEVPARIRFGGMIYMSSIERAGRREKNLTIREIKTGNFIGGPDHLLQTWGYCISAPSILSTKGFTADRIQWQVEYPQARERVGPRTFSQRALSLVLEAMEQFEDTHAAGRANGGRVEIVRVSPAKCRQCAFVHDCRWAHAAASQTA